MGAMPFWRLTAVLHPRAAGSSIRAMRGVVMLSTMLLAMTVSGCGLFRKKPKPPPPASPRVVIGTVHMTNPQMNFALIQTPGRASLPPGADLISSNEGGESSRMKVSPERKGVFLTADIVSGEPVKGDMVIWLRGEAAVSEPVNTPPAEPSARISLPSAAPTSEPAPLPVLEVQLPP